MEKEICCLKFDPKPWDDVEIIWKNKRFIRGIVPTFMYMPIGFGRVISKLQKKVNGDIPDGMCLSNHLSKWKMEVLLAVPNKIKGELNILLTGKYYSKVFEGDFKNTKDWMEEFELLIHEKNYQYEELYMWYTTCPKCAKKYGKNYVVILARIG